MCQLTLEISPYKSFLDDLEATVSDCVSKTGYARRAEVRLALWKQHRMNKKISAFFLDILQEQGRIKIGNRGVYLAEGFHGC